LIHYIASFVRSYISSSIDKSNLGNAKTDGLDVDLHFHGNQYNILLSIFYVPFVLSGPPMNMLTKRFGAHRILPGAMLIFGSMAMLSAACKNFGGIVTTRWFLGESEFCRNVVLWLTIKPTGMAESGFFPGVIYYLTTFYKRGELASRLSLYYSASSIAGAFTGLIAFGVFQIDGPIKGWQYLFVIVR
jgi:MFS family permease